MWGQTNNYYFFALWYAFHCQSAWLDYDHTLVQWWRHFIMLPHRHMVTGFKPTNQPEHESDDRSGDTVTSVCVTDKKDTILQRQIWSTFVTVLWCSRTKITDGTGISVLVGVLQDVISKIYWQFWHGFFKYALESSFNFNGILIPLKY